MASIIVPAVFKKDRKTEMVRALLDTGTECTMLSMDVAKKIGVKRLGSAGIVGAGGRVTMYVGSVDLVEIPQSGCACGPMRIVVYDKWAFPMGGLTGVEGMIGLDFMLRARMEIRAFAETGIVRCSPNPLHPTQSIGSRISQLGEFVRSIRASKGRL